MERRIRIFEMDKMADPVALAHSRLVHDRLPPEYTAEGEARHQPQGCQEQQRRPLVVRYGSRRPAGEWALPRFPLFFRQVPLRL
jgi:hypothetical protein